MPRCLSCNQKFEPKRFLQKHCESEECKIAESEYQKEKITSSANKERTLKPTKIPACKGLGIAKGHGCGTPQKNRIHGLGIDCRCYSKWLLNTPEGAEKLKRTTITVSEKAIRQRKIDERNKTKESKIDLMSADAYRAKILQPVINEIARLIDFGQPCIATGNYGKENGGHYISVGANRTICLNLHNIHIQSYESNHHKSGDTLNYQNGIVDIYGQEYLDFMNGLKSHPLLKLTKQDLIEIYKLAKPIRNSLAKNPQPLNTEERIQLRNDINQALNIYMDEYCVFKT